jgi:hypothetical protein
MKPIAIVMSAVLIIGAGVAWFWLNHQPETATPLVQTAQEPSIEASSTLHQGIRDLPPTASIPEPSEPNTSKVPPPDIVMPPANLQHSDPSVAAAATDLSANIAGWLLPKEQIRKWVILVDNIATGKVPLKSRPLDFPMAAFTVQGSDTKPTLSSKNYQRATPLVDAFTGLDTALMARYYRAWQPLLQQAYAELGQPGDFHQRLLQAIDQVLAVEPLSGEHIELKQPAVYYTFADPEKEQASDVEKLLWRLGPQNTARIQAHLQALKTQL